MKVSKKYWYLLLSLFGITVVYNNFGWSNESESSQNFIQIAPITSASSTASTEISAEEDGLKSKNASASKQISKESTEELPKNAREASGLVSRLIGCVVMENALEESGLSLYGASNNEEFSGCRSFDSEDSGLTLYFLSSKASNDFYRKNPVSIESGKPFERILIYEKLVLVAIGDEQSKQTVDDIDNFFIEIGYRRVNGN